MLHHTFCHIPGIGPKTERRLWEAGVLSWSDVEQRDLDGVLHHSAPTVLHHAQEAIERLESGDVRYFYERLPSSEHWRLFPDFRRSVAYVDIETTGLGGPDDYITVIGLYDGSRVRHYVYDENLEDFARDVEEYQLLVTYNGKQFDLPFIRNYLGAPMNHAHIDLRYVLHSLGYKGGLKGCERKLGIERGELDGIDGYFAVLLWQDFNRGGNQAALQTLLAYNAADVVNLEALMILAYNMKLQETAFAATHRLDVPAPPPMDLRADSTTVQRLRRDRFWF
jgi:uncharacterized protein YprB with RNaseH-like and TPR domain